MWSSGLENLAHTAGRETKEEKPDRGCSIGAERTQRLSRTHTYVTDMSATNHVKCYVSEIVFKKL